MPVLMPMCRRQSDRGNGRGISTATQTTLLQWEWKDTSSAPPLQGSYAWQGSYMPKEWRGEGATGHASKQTITSPVFAPVTPCSARRMGDPLPQQHSTIAHLLHVRASNTRVAVNLGIPASRLLPRMGKVARAPIMDVSYGARQDLRGTRPE